MTQSTWEVQAQNIDSNNYFGVTVANGMIGLVSSPTPMHIQYVVLNGVFDPYQRAEEMAKVGNTILKYFYIHSNICIFANI